MSGACCSPDRMLRKRLRCRFRRHQITEAGQAGGAGDGVWRWNGRRQRRGCNRVWGRRSRFIDLLRRGLSGWNQYGGLRLCQGRIVSGVMPQSIGEGGQTGDQHQHDRRYDDSASRRRRWRWWLGSVGHLLNRCVLCVAPVVFGTAQGVEDIAHVSAEGAASVCFSRGRWR